MTSTTKIRLEVGKTYITRDGTRRITIDSESGYKGTYRMCGEDEQGRITWRSITGRFDRHPGPLDLIAEA